MYQFSLLTPRLHLREFRPEDAAGFFALNADPEVMRYTGDDPFADVAAAEQFLRNYMVVYQRDGYGRWTVLDRHTGAYLGWCGLRKQTDSPDTDLGYRFLRTQWGNGYATEASAACLAYGFNTLGLERIIARAMHGNLASIRVMEKLGMHYDHDFDFDRHPGVCYVVDQLTWQKNQQP